MIIADLAPHTVQLIVHYLNIQSWGCSFLHFQTKSRILASYNNGGMQRLNARRRESFVCGLDQCMAVVNMVLNIWIQ